MTTSNISRTRFWPAVLAMGAALGCSAQVEKGYRGEPLLSLQGAVVIADPGAQDLVPTLAFAAKEGYALVDATVEGTFPSGFRMDVVDPPPASALYGADLPAGFKGALGFGFITVVPRAHASLVPMLRKSSSDSCSLDDAGPCTEHVEACTDAGACVSRTLECTSERCPVVGETGPTLAPSDVATHESMIYPNVGAAMAVDETCNDRHECHRVFRKCDITSKSQVPWSGGILQTCAVHEESGKLELKQYEYLEEAVVGYTVLYLTDRNTVPGYGDLGPGYHLFRQSAPSSDQAWIESIECDRDSVSGTTCPAVIQPELVENPLAQALTLTLGSRIPGASP